ncbi:formylglycine-generating enzyme family protein [Brucella sp. BE17]|uniref:formylglycine-generating enzyme family protein n=1 Tax=Brucella sp. BE17 TaxID=3142977 RepID=UPI0031BA1BB1
MKNCCTQIGRGPAGHVNDELIAIVSDRGSAGEAVAIKGGETFVGTDEPVFAADGEGPTRKGRINDFWLETETVTVVRFAAFIAATGYRTDAEKYGCAAVFTGLTADDERHEERVALTPWWARVDGAVWNAPEGPGSSIVDRLDHPVTQVSWNDAVAFASWAGGRLPTEMEWEHAARGGNQWRRYPWGNDEPTDEKIFCNIWQGVFPKQNTMADGFLGTAPARSFNPTETGLYNLAGNVWEWTADSFRVRSLARQAKIRNQQARENAEKVLKGGSFLCHKSYCHRYRIAARMGLSPDSGASNTGFRIAYDKFPSSLDV